LNPYVFPRNIDLDQKAKEKEKEENSVFGASLEEVMDKQKDLLPELKYPRILGILILLK
jgi:hypothetical protein